MAKRKAVTTNRAIHALKPEEKKYTCAVNAPKMARGGLLIQVTPKGSKTFYSRLRLSSKQIDVRLGLVHDLTLPEAVDAHNEAVGLVDRGIDPRLHIRAEKAEREAELTMNRLVERWCSHREQAGELKPRTIKDDRWRWGKYLEPTLGNLKITEINRRVLAAALDAARKHSRDETRKSLNMLNGCLDYALSRQLVEENPARLLKPKDFAATPSKPRDRWLSIPELHQLWQYLDSDQHQTTLHIINLIKLIILTGARRGELAGMVWEELDLKAGLWTLPAERAKNGQRHVFYLHPLSIELLKELQPLTGHSSYVFQSPKSDQIKSISPNAVTRAVTRIRDVLKEKEGIPSFSAHDLRRTCASHWADTLEADSRLAELMLNHLPADKLVRTYQQGKQPERQKTVWHRWGELIVRSVIQDPDNEGGLKAQADNVIRASFGR